MRKLAQHLIRRYERRHGRRLRKLETIQEIAESTVEELTPAWINYPLHDRFDFVLCEPADEIRARGLGVLL